MKNEKKENFINPLNIVRNAEDIWESGKNTVTGVVTGDFEGAGKAFEGVDTITSGGVTAAYEFGSDISKGEFGDAIAGVVGQGQKVFNEQGAVVITDTVADVIKAETGVDLNPYLPQTMINSYADSAQTIAKSDNRCQLCTNVVDALIDEIIGGKIKKGKTATAKTCGKIKTKAVKKCALKAAASGQAWLGGVATFLGEVFGKQCGKAVKKGLKLSQVGDSVKCFICSKLHLQNGMNPLCYNCKSGDCPCDSVPTNAE